MGRRIASRPTAEAGSACHRARRSSGPAHLARTACLRAAPRCSHASRPDQRQSATAAWRPCAGDARRAAAMACLHFHTPAFICCPRCAPPHFALPLSQMQQQQQRALLAPPNAAAASPATYPSSHASILRFPPPEALPSLPASLALARGRRRRGKGRAWLPPSSRCRGRVVRHAAGPMPPS